MEETTYPFWYRLITFLKSQNEISTGLTIPYLIGAKTILDESYIVNDKSIEILLNEVINSSTDEIPFFQECMEIREFVIGLVDKNYAESLLTKEVYLSNSNDDKKLYILGDACNFGSSVEEISQKLNQFYLPDLMKKNFSWDSKEKEWRQFNKDEREKIERCFNKFSN